MGLQGGCYCGEIRYDAGGDAEVKLQCHCRECQYISGGGPNFLMILPKAAFAFTKGTPAEFTRSDLDAPVTRVFCPTCGTHLLTRTPRRPDGVGIKVGTLDDPAAFGGPKVAIFHCDAQPFHEVGDGVVTFDRVPG